MAFINTIDFISIDENIEDTILTHLCFKDRNIRSQEFRDLLPNLTSLAGDGYTEELSYIQTLNLQLQLQKIQLYDCLDEIPVPGSQPGDGHLFLADDIGANRFMTENPTALRINLYKGEDAILDTASSDILGLWRSHRIFERIFEALESDRNVVVNCAMGISRSTSTIMGFLMWVSHRRGLPVLDVEEHIRFLRDLRWQPNGSRQLVEPKFTYQLGQLYTELTGRKCIAWFGY